MEEAQYTISIWQATLVLGLKNSPGGLVPIILVKGDLKYEAA